MKSLLIQPVILAGGSGTRLWPISRADHPKQYQVLLGEESMLVATARRLQGLPGVLPPVVVCGERHRFTVAGQMAEAGLPLGDILIEPAGRNTGPAIAAAARYLNDAPAARPSDTVLLVLPADHHIGDLQRFQKDLLVAVGEASAGRIVTFGIVPDHAETGYGYIRQGDARDADGRIFDIDAFVEKPDAATAAALLDDGRHLWNSGMFIVRIDVVLDELARHAPEMAARAVTATADARADMDFVRLSSDFLQMPAQAFDVAVMERTRIGSVIRAAFSWSDVGSWRALHAIEAHDADGNALRGRVELLGARDCYVRADHGLVTAVGVRDLIIVSTADAVLVVDRNHDQDIKQLVEKLVVRKVPEALHHNRIYRPWGFYEQLHVGGRHQVKHLMVKPGGILSLQMHYHRAEHWVVVTGTARVTVDDSTRLLTENQSIYLPLGARHRLENPGKVPLSIIEVQSGAYLGEDDIERLEDHYGRKPSES